MTAATTMTTGHADQMSSLVPSWWTRHYSSRRHSTTTRPVRVALHRGLRRNDVVVGAAVTVQMCRIATTPSTLAQADQGVRVAVSRRWTIDDVVIIGYLRHRRDF